MFNRAKFSVLTTAMFAAIGDGSAGGSFADAVGATVPGAPGAPTVVNGREFSYFFKTEKVRDENNNIIGDGRKHPNVVAVLPVVQVGDIIDKLSYLGEMETLEDGKTQRPTSRAKTAALILETVQDLHYQAGRSQINDFLEKNPAGTFTATNFDLSKLTLEYVASQDRASRGVWSPSEEDMKSFNEDYTMIFVQEVQYDPKRVKVHCEQFSKGYAKIRNDKIALGKMQEFLTVWAGKTQNMEQNFQTYEWLLARSNKYLKADDRNFADAL